MLNRVTAAQAVEQVISSLRAGADPTEALTILLGQARLMLEAKETYILLREGDSLVFRAGAGLPERSRECTLRIGEGIEGLAAQRGEPIVLRDASAYRCFADDLDDKREVGAVVAYPMMTRGQVIGVIAATKPPADRFGGIDLWWLDLLGGLAAVVVEHDRASRAERRRARQAEVLLDVVSQSGGDPESLLQRLADIITRDLDVDRVDILLLDQSGASLQCLGSSGGDRPAPRYRIDVVGHGPLALVLEAGHPYVGNGLGSELAIDSNRRPIRAHLVVPIQVEGKRRGVLALGISSRSTFVPDDQSLALVIAARIGVLIEEAELGRRRLEIERLEAEAAARQTLVGIVSHELKTPVAVIQAYVDVLLRRAERSGDSANTDVLKRMSNQSDRMLYMIEQILDLQRLESGLMTIETSRFDLAALVRRVCEEMSSISQRHGIVVDAKAEIYVEADRRRIEEVLQNVIQNAAKYSPAGATIAARVAIDPGDNTKALVSIEDEGAGISADELPRVFDRFYQGTNRLYQGHVGLGLGLHISRELVRRHGGEMWVESRVGEGSRFSFTIPLKRPFDDV